VVEENGNASAPLRRLEKMAAAKDHICSLAPPARTHGHQHANAAPAALECKARRAGAAAQLLEKRPCLTPHIASGFRRVRLVWPYAYGFASDVLGRDPILVGLKSSARIQGFPARWLQGIDTYNNHGGDKRVAIGGGGVCWSFRNLLLAAEAFLQSDTVCPITRNNPF